jgi:hypothetical protein
MPGSGITKTTLPTWYTLPAHQRTEVHYSARYIDEYGIDVTGVEVVKGIIAAANK